MSIKPVRLTPQTFLIIYINQLTYHQLTHSYMNKKTKFIYYSYLTLIGLLLSVMITGACLWFISSFIRAKNRPIHEQARGLITQQLNVADNEISGSCIYPEDKRFIIVSLNHQDYFIIKDGQVRIYDAINNETKKKYPNLPVDNEFVDFYWVLEECR